MATVPGLILPTTVATLVVPAATVAEILLHPPELHPLPGVEPWVLGYFRWRNCPVTLVSFDRLAADREISQFSRVCVLYPLPGRESFDYFALAMKGDPRSVEVPDSAAAESLPADVSPRFAAGAVKINDRILVIPDFDAFETAFYPRR